MPIGMTQSVFTLRRRWRITAAPNPTCPSCTTNTSVGSAQPGISTDKKKLKSAESHKPNASEHVGSCQNFPNSRTSQTISHVTKSQKPGDQTWSTPWESTTEMVVCWPHHMEHLQTRKAIRESDDAVCSTGKTTHTWCSQEHLTDSSLVVRGCRNLEKDGKHKMTTHQDLWKRIEKAWRAQPSNLTLRATKVKTHAEAHEVAGDPGPDLEKFYSDEADKLAIRAERHAIRRNVAIKHARANTSSPLLVQSSSTADQSSMANQMSKKHRTSWNSCLKTSHMKRTIPLDIRPEVWTMQDGVPIDVRRR